MGKVFENNYSDKKSRPMCSYHHWLQPNKNFSVCDKMSILSFDLYKCTFFFSVTIILNSLFTSHSLTIETIIITVNNTNKIIKSYTW